MDFVRELLGQGKDVFLDMKYYDIGETVKRAVAGGRAQRRAVPDGARQQPGDAGGGGRARRCRLKTAGGNCAHQLRPGGFGGYGLPVRRCRSGCAAGAQSHRGAAWMGWCASPLDAQAVRAQAGPQAILVTPGVRSGGAAKGDQKRVATPAEAIAQRRGLCGDGAADHARRGSGGGSSARSR